jgi:hypothetical protein
MIRVYLCILIIFLALGGCKAKNSSEPEKVSEITNKTFSSEEDLAKEIQTMGKRDFRKTTWGMDKATVKLTEPDDPTSENDTSLIYSRQVAGMRALMGYVFVDDKLVRAKYMFRPQHPDLNVYITDHDTLEKVMVKKYGKPKKERTIWANDLYTNSPSQWGFALGEGYVTFISYWETPKSEITLTMQGKDNKIDFWLEYKSKVLGKLEKTDSQKK